MYYRLDDYVNQLPKRNIIRQDLLDSKINLENVLLGVYGRREDANGVDFDFYKKNGVNLYYWNERLSLIDSIQNSNNIDVGFSKLLIEEYTKGKLARKIREAKAFIREYGSMNLDEIKDTSKRVAYNQKRKKDKYKRCIEIIEKADKIYNKSLKIIETYNNNEQLIKFEPANKKLNISPRERRDHACCDKYFDISRKFKKGEKMSAEEFEDIVAEYQGNKSRLSFDERIGEIFFKGYDFVAEKIDYLMLPFDKKINSFLYGNPDYTRQPFDLTPGEIIARKMKKSVSDLREKTNNFIEEVEKVPKYCLDRLSIGLNYCLQVLF